MQRISPISRATSLITGDSVMAGLIRTFHWAATSLGPIDAWSETLIASINLMLHSPFPTIVSWGPDLHFLYNDAVIPTLGDKHPRALGRRFEDVFPEAWSYVCPGIYACLEQGKTSSYDNVLIPILMNGVSQDHYWNYAISPIYERSLIGGIFYTYRNVTETVLNARKLSESEARLKLATNVAQLGVFVWDSVNDTGTWENDRMYELFGRSRGDGLVNAENFLNEFIHPDYREGFVLATEATVKHGEPFCYECPIFLPGKTLRHIEICGELQPGTHGIILGTIRDITADRLHDEVLRNNAKRLGELAAIVASSEDVILSKDLNGIITSWNEAATRVFGYTADEMIGTSILRLIPEHLYSDEKHIIESIRAGRRVEHFDTVRLTKDGRLIDVSLTISPIKDPQGRIIGASKILRDISSRKRMEESLLQAEKIAATGRMAATIAHEINNPLESVMNLLYLMRDKIEDHEGANYLATAESELARVSHIAKQTLGYYREETAATPASLSELVKHALTIYEPRCTAANISVNRSFTSAARLVLRRGELMQVVSNLIANSIYAMPGGGVLSLSVADTADPVAGVTLTIADTGIGIPSQNLPRIFDAFYTTRNVGTGIGLFIVKQFVEAHGGHITLETSTAAHDHGSTFRIFMPRQTTYALSQSPPTLLQTSQA